MVSTRVPAPDYTSRDYDVMLERLKRLIQSVFPEWTDFNVADFGNSLLRANSFVSDVLSFHTDFWANESLPGHAILRRSIVSHARWLGYELSGRTAAQVTVTVSTLNGQPHGEDITIRAGTIFRVPSPINPIDFQVLTDTVFPGTDSSVQVLLENSENAEGEEFSTGKANQVYRLSQSPYVEESLVVQADDGAYTKVSNFLLSSDTDKHFMVEVDDEERPVVRFGTGVNGKIPVGTIDFTYAVGGGRSGNVETGITEILDEIVDDLGNTVSLTVTQTNPAQGGDDPESIERARLSAPAELRVLNRTVSREDFETDALDVPGVSAVLFVTSSETVQIRENEGVGYIVARGAKNANGNYLPAAPTQALIDAVEDYWANTKPHLLSFRPRAVGKSGKFFLEVNIECTVYCGPSANKTRPTPTDPTIVGKAIYDLISDYFAVEDSSGNRIKNIDFGFNLKKSDGTPVSEIPWSDILNIIRDYEGVRKIDPSDLSLNGKVSSVPIRIFNFPILGTVNLIDGETGQPLYP